MESCEKVKTDAIVKNQEQVQEGKKGGGERGECKQEEEEEELESVSPGPPYQQLAMLEHLSLTLG